MNLYVLDQNTKYIYSNPDYTGQKIFVPIDINHPILVNILERRKTEYDVALKVKLFYADGEILEGWISQHLANISITNMDELFDGRFNQ